MGGVSTWASEPTDTIRGVSDLPSVLSTGFGEPASGSKYERRESHIGKNPENALNVLIGIFSAMWLATILSFHHFGYCRASSAQLEPSASHFGSNYCTSTMGSAGSVPRKASAFDRAGPQASRASKPVSAVEAVSYLFREVPFWTPS